MDHQPPPAKPDEQTDANQAYVDWFRQSSPYINTHRGKTFVLMLPGAALEHRNFDNIVHDITLLTSLGVRLVLVHGTRPQIDARLRAAGTESSFHNNLRITDQRSMTHVAEAAGATRTAIEAALSTGLPNSPMHGAYIRVVSGNFITAKPLGVRDGIDLQHTGQVRRIDSDAVHRALAGNAVVLLSPLGYSPTGEVFNLACTDVATEVAVALGADKLIAFNAGGGIRDRRQKLVRELNLRQCADLLAANAGNADAYEVLHACRQACSRGVTRAQIISYSEDGALIKELFTRDGRGTMVYRDSYEVVRRARIDDVGGIIELISPLEEQGILVRRSRELLETEVDHFTVMEKDGMIVACAALYPYPEKFTGELACVVTHSDYRNGGRAAKLLTHIERQARRLKLRTLFTLTTQTAHWFVEQGFAAGGVDDLPDSRQSLYNYQRNSKIFVRSLVST
ncbi:amino-acid N-acetyltransferase [Exilibacterium tricleocarpae]|uniref:Amino-acid acetyltransferase n=1 Tax=Exilibacterium tricleocarpae TaxID=2591008 RepID=A0A545TK80_9GAMM|nr:amino-acid N-acetyltransferase [Exilibacterium tricleocarpae]TQV77640.1 amino-acid N-acetyltransferase [Exilibacterium tricleocarpae]